MSPADAAAYTALDLPPGSPWPMVHDAWRRLMKAHHPDVGAMTVFDERRVREANAAYAHLGRSGVRAGPSIARTRRIGAPRAAVWDVLWGAAAWPEWLPGLRLASAASGGSDRRVTLAGRWAGHRVGGQLVLMTVTPPWRLSGRLLHLRIDGEHAACAPPRVWARAEEAPGAGTDVELGIALPDGRPLPAVIAAALDAALVELGELAAAR